MYGLRLKYKYAVKGETGDRVAVAAVVIAGMLIRACSGSIPRRDRQPVGAGPGVVVVRRRNRHRPPGRDRAQYASSSLSRANASQPHSAGTYVVHARKSKVAAAARSWGTPA